MTGPALALSLALALAAALDAGAPAPTVDAIFREHGAFVWRALRRLGVREADVDDVCQEVFVVVHRRLSFEGRSQLRTWVYGICVRVASDYRKSARVRREVVSEDVPDAPVSGHDDVVALRQARALLDGILETLDDDKRAVFVLFEIEGLGMAEVAAAVGVPLQTAYTRLYAARKIVRPIAACARGSWAGGVVSDSGTAGRRRDAGSRRASWPATTPRSGARGGGAVRAARPVRASTRSARG